MARKNFKNAISNVINKVEDKQALVDNRVEVKILNIDELMDHPKNEEIFDDRKGQEHEELLESIKEFGILEPLIVRPLDIGKYQILAGHRRKNIATELGITELPCRIMNLNDVDAELVLISTNTKSRKLTDMELARAIKREKELIQVKIQSGEIQGKASDYVAENFDMSASTVKRLDRLNRLIPEFQELVHNSEIATGKAQEIALLDDETQKNLYELMKNKFEEIKLKDIKVFREKYESELNSLKEEKQRIEDQKKQLEVIMKNQSDKSLQEKVEIEKKLQEVAQKESELIKKQEEIKSVDEIKNTLLKTKEELEKLKNQKPEVIEKEVIPEDYERLKKIAEEKEELEKLIEEDQIQNNYKGIILANIKYLRLTLDNSYTEIEEAIANIKKDNEINKAFEMLYTSFGNFDKFL